MKTVRPRLILIFSILAAVLITIGACTFIGSGRSSDVDVTSEKSTSSLQSGELECEVEGYPCTYAEADPDVLARSAEALDEAAEILDESESIDAAVEALSERSDLAEITFAPEAIRFRLENGPPMWLINGAAIAPNAKGIGSPGDNGNVNVSVEDGRINLTFGQDDGPIGESNQGVEPFKKALILSPFWWDFGGDETQALASMLRRVHRNYNCDECEVRYKINNVRNQESGESPEDFLLTRTLSLDYGISIVDYMSWDNYDLVHVSSHGTQICPESGCRGVLMTGRFVTDPELTENGLPDIDIPGVLWGKTAVPGCGSLERKMETDGIPDAEWEAAYEEWKNKGCGTYTNRWWQFIGPDFFRAHYGGQGKSLDDKLIFFNSCQSMKDLSLANSIAGDNTTVLGWTEVVDADAAGDVAMDFYELYVRQGLRAKPAFEEAKEQLGQAGERLALRRFKPKGIEIEALLPPEFTQEGDQDTRGREIISLLQPVFRFELEERDAIPTSGVPGDGEPDQLLILVQIDGVDEDQKPEEFKIHIAVDGVELEKTIKPQQKTDEYSYQALGFFELSFDVGDRDYIELEAWVDLPEGGESRHVLEVVELAKCGWTANLSGARSGETKGDIVLPTSTFSIATVEQLSQLAEEGYLGPDTAGSGALPTADQLANLPEAFMLGDGDEVPFFFLIPGQGVTAIFDRTSLAAGNQVQVTKRNDDESKTGSFSATLTDVRLQQNFSAQGEYTWHKDSYCSMDVILEMAENPFPESMVPEGFGEE